jgi:hypothetical protein
MFHIYIYSTKYKVGGRTLYLVLNFLRQLFLNSWVFSQVVQAEGDRVGRGVDS